MSFIIYYYLFILYCLLFIFARLKLYIYYSFICEHQKKQLDRSWFIQSHIFNKIHTVHKVIAIVFRFIQFLWQNSKLYVFLSSPIISICILFYFFINE